MIMMDREHAKARIARYVNFTNAEIALDKAEFDMPGEKLGIGCLPGWGEGDLAVTFHGRGLFTVQEPVQPQSLATLGNDTDELVKHLTNALAAAVEVRDQARAASQHRESRREDTARIIRWGEMLNTAMGQAQDQADTVDIEFRSWAREQENG